MDTEQDTTKPYSLDTYFDSGESTSRGLLVWSAVLSIAYFLVLMFWFRVENVWLFAILMAGQAFYLWQGLNYLFTIWNTDAKAQFDRSYLPRVDVFITVAGEPTSLVEETLRAAVDMDYPDFKVYLLNDGYVAKKDNWREMEELARRYGPVAECITRTVPGGAKAGNINHALLRTDAPLVAIFDADHVPHKDFLRKTVGYFIERRMGFVQTPQFYRNYEENDITLGAWEQQEIFFGPICRGRNRFRAVTMCGTNMVISRAALEEVGGMCDFNIAEDFITGMFLHERGWQSYYVPEILAEGLAPADFLSYYKQQLRWARGSLEVFFKFNPLFRRGLSWPKRSVYLASSGYYLSGMVVLINALLPLIFFFTGAVPFAVSTMALAAAFIPYIFLMIYTIQQSTNYAYTFRALAFSMGSFIVHLRAFFSVLGGKRGVFAVTSKTRVAGNFLELALPHLFYIGLAACGITVALLRDGVTPSLVANCAWAALNIVAFSPFIAAATPEAVPERPQARYSPRDKKVPRYGYVKSRRQ